MGVINFIKNILGFETEKEIIGLARFEVENFDTEENLVKFDSKKEPTLTQLLRKAN